MHKPSNNVVAKTIRSTHKYPLQRALCLATLTLAVHQAYAADDTATQTLGVVNVTATQKNGADAPTHGYAVKSSKSATKTDTELKEIPQSVSVVTKQQIEDQKARTIAEALRYTPGVETGFHGSRTDSDTIILRGFADDYASNNEYLDGLRLISSVNYSNRLQIDPYYVERIDVIRGPASVTYGQANPGGLIAISSKLPLDDDYHEVFATVGNHSQRAMGLDFGGKVPGSDNLTYRLVVKGSAGEQQQADSKYERYVVAPSLKWKIDDKNTLLLQAYLQKDPSSGYIGNVPYEGTVIPHNGITLSPSYNEGQAGDGTRHSQQYYGYQFTHAFNDNWSFQSQYRFETSTVNTLTHTQYGWVSSTSNTPLPWVLQELEKSNAHMLDNHIQGLFTTGPIKHSLLAGVDYQHSEDSGYNYSSYGVTSSAYTTIKNMDDKRDQVGGYLQDQLAWGKWRLTLGLREDHAKTNTTEVGISNVTNAKYEWSGSKLTKRIGLNYLADNGLSPYISYSDGFNPALASNYDATGKQLGPKTSKQTEAGIRFQPVGSQTTLSAAVFDLTQYNVASYDSTTFTYKPVGTVETKGLELEANSKLTDQLSLLASYTYNNAQITQGTDQGKSPYMVPHQRASLWLDYAFNSGLSVGGGVHYRSSAWVDNDNTAKLPDVTLVDMSLRYDLSRFSASLHGTTLTLNANNLLNKTYVASCYNTTSWCYYGEKRNITLTASKKW